MTTKAPGAFRTIGEVSDLLATPAHVLRFWESRFPQIKPVKRAGGRRYYRPTDVALLGGIKRLLHDDGMTIRGVQKLLRDHGVRHVCAMAPEAAAEDAAMPEPVAPEDTTAPQPPAAPPAPPAPSPAPLTRPTVESDVPQRPATRLRMTETMDSGRAARLLERCAQLVARRRAAQSAEGA